MNFTFATSKQPISLYYKCSFIYSAGHKGMYGHEYLEFEIRPDGLLRYANHSNYKKDTVIRKQVHLSPKMLQIFQKILQDSDALSHSKINDKDWPMPDRNGAQELEIVMGGVHWNVSTAKIHSLIDIQNANAPGKKYSFNLKYFLNLKYSSIYI